MKRECIHGHTLSPFCWTLEPTSLFFWQTQTCWQKTTGDNLSVGFLYYKKVYIGAEPLTLSPNSRTYFLIILLLEYSAQWTRNFSHQCGTTWKDVQRNNHSHYFWITAPTSLCFCNIQPNWHKITANHVAVYYLIKRCIQGYNLSPYCPTSEIWLRLFTTNQHSPPTRNS